MNTHIANIILGEIDSLTWLDKYAGLVRSVTTKTTNGDRQTFPYAINVVTGDCDLTTRTDLVPNSAYKSVLYFEEFGSSTITKDPQTKAYNVTTELRIVAWLNGEKIQWNSEQAFTSIWKLLSELHPYFESGDYKRIRITNIVQEQKTPAIFSRYTYDETLTQYLMHPHDYMSMVLTVVYMTSPDCFTETEVNLDECGEV